ncbi:hypothetical protein PIB30_097942, partial [Stylosanthes scabra]|nr:hypothetical protein [Stylosanthes scabra]
MESVRENERVALEHYNPTLLVDIFSKLISCAGEINKGATILSSNTLVQEWTSRFRPALRLSRRSWVESAAFGTLRLNPGSTSVHLGEPVQWVNQPMVHLVNRSIGLDQSTPVNSSQPPVNRWSTL